MALIVSQLMSLHDQSNVSTSPASSEERLIPLIRRLSVFTVTLNLSRRSSPIGCSASEATAPCVHVRSGAHLQRYAAVPHVGRQPAERDATVGIHGDVVDDANPVAQAFGVAPLDRLPDRGEAEGLTGMQSGVEVLRVARGGTRRGARWAGSPPRDPRRRSRRRRRRGSAPPARRSHGSVPRCASPTATRARRWVVRRPWRVPWPCRNPRAPTRALPRALRPRSVCSSGAKRTSA